MYDEDDVGFAPQTESRAWHTMNFPICLVSWSCAIKSSD
jgi:hypothetical protein